MEIKLMLSEMARLGTTPKQTRIYFHRIDLFRPNGIHPKTEDRYYSINQRKELGIIPCPRNLGTGLNQIKTYLPKSPQRQANDIVPKGCGARNFHRAPMVFKRLWGRTETDQCLGIPIP